MYSFQSRQVSYARKKRDFTLWIQMISVPLGFSLSGCSPVLFNPNKTLPTGSRTTLATGQQPALAVLYSDFYSNGKPTGCSTLSSQGAPASPAVMIQPLDDFALPYDFSGGGFPYNRLSGQRGAFNYGGTATTNPAFRRSLLLRLTI